VEYKSILVHSEPTAEADERLAVAAELVRRCDGRLLAIGAHEPFDFIDLGYGFLDGATIQAIDDAIKAQFTDAEARARAAAKNLPFFWRAVMGDPVEVLAARSCAADLIVASRTPHPHDRDAFAPAGDLIMSSGLPVLVLPPGARPLGGGPALIGWKNTLQSRAAISAALPLLKAASEVLLFRVTTKDDLDPAAEIEDVAERLRQHGVRVHADLRPRGHRAVSLDVLERAHEAGAEVLVMGAYAHSRTAEWVFGGVTDDLLRGADLPVLFAR
jgi:nucleotide-binding universal stress UspA family protein